MEGAGKVSWKRFQKFLLRVDCQFKSQESRHIKYKKPGLLRPIIVPKVDEPRFHNFEQPQNAWYLEGEILGDDLNC
jgi:hypothetical protein